MPHFRLGGDDNSLSSPPRFCHNAPRHETEYDDFRAGMMNLFENTPREDKRLAAVTGAGGFIASHLVETLLKRGWSVRALVHYNALQSLGHLQGNDRHAAPPEKPGSRKTDFKSFRRRDGSGRWLPLSKVPTWACTWPR